MKCECGREMTERQIKKHFCLSCGGTFHENVYIESPNYEKAWKELEKWLKEVQPFITVTVADVKLKMKEIIDEQ